MSLGIRREQGILRIVVVGIVVQSDWVVGFGSWVEEWSGFRVEGAWCGGKGFVVMKRMRGEKGGGMGNGNGSG